MTRTARAAYPRAVIKDRSESRTGLDPSIRKSGAGHHNWGSLADALRLDEAAIGDEELEITEVPVSPSLADSTSSSTRCKHAFHSLFSASITHSFLQLFRLRGKLRTLRSLLKKRSKGPAISGRTPSRETVRHSFLSNHNHSNSDFNARY